MGNAAMVPSLSLPTTGPAAARRRKIHSRTRSRESQVRRTLPTWILKIMTRSRLQTQAALQSIRQWKTSMSRALASTRTP